MNLNEYEKRLLGLSAMEFERLVRDLLMKEYPTARNFNHSGKQVGRDAPTHGVDIWFTSTKFDKEYFTFVEITTQQHGLGKKIISDIKKASKLIKKEGFKINEVIYACIGKISPTTYKSAKNILAEAGIVGESNLVIWNIDEIIRLLKIKYPVLAEEYLGIKIYSGCIVPIDQFRNKFNVVQDNKFLYRDIEKEEIKSILEKEKAIVLYGPAGCGKTRIALQIFEELMRNSNDIQCHIVKMSGAGLLEDIKVFLEDTRVQHYILVDDANRASYIGDLGVFVENQNNIHIIFTVRDYAVDSVMKALDQTSIVKYEIEPFINEKIIEIIKNGFNIQNKKTLQYILDISKGTLRFAIMAAQLIKENKIYGKELPDLLEKYFNDVRERIDTFNSEGKAERILAALSLFKKIDIRDTEFLENIGKVFGFSQKEFYEYCDHMDDTETINYHFDKNVISIADQILADYLFYKIVIKDKKIALDQIFIKFLSDYRKKLVDLFQSIINIYGPDEELLGQLKRILTKLVTEQDAIIDDYTDSLLIKYIGMFYNIIPEEILAYIISKLDEVSVEAKRAYDEYHTDIYGKIIGILGGYADSQYDEKAIDILIEFIMQKPNLYSEIKHCLCENFTITNVSHINDYRTQIYLLKKVIGLKDFANHADLLSSILIKQFPHTQHSSESNGRQVTYYTIRLLVTEGAREHRALIWQGIQNLLSCVDDKTKILEIVSQGSHGEDSEELKKIDRNNIVDIYNEINTSTLRDRLFALNLLGPYRRMKHVKDIVAQLLTDPILEYYFNTISVFNKKHLYGKALQQEIKKLSSIVSFEEIIKGLVAVSEYVNDGYSSWQCNESIETVFDVLYETNIQDCISLAKYYIDIHPKTRIRPGVLTNKLAANLPFEDVVAIIKKSKLECKTNWIAQLLIGLPKNKINDSVYNFAINFFINYYPVTTTRWGNERLSNLMQFEEYRAGFMYIIIQAYYKDDKNKILKHFCEFLFNDDYSIEEMVSIFRNDIQMIKDVYLKLANSNTYMDTKGVWAIKLFANDNDSKEKLLSMFIDKDNEYFPENVFYGFSNFVNIFIKEILSKKYFYLNSSVRRLIFGMDNAMFDEFCRLYLFNCKDDEARMFELGAILEDAPKDRQIRSVELMIENKLSVVTMRHMPLFSGPTSWTNSKIPYIKANIETVKTFLEMHKTPVRYELFLKEKLNYLNTMLKNTEIEEFNSDWFE